MTEALKAAKFYPNQPPAVLLEIKAATRFLQRVAEETETHHHQQQHDTKAA